MPAHPTPDRRPVGRGAGFNPANRYEKTHVEPDAEQLAWWEEETPERPTLKTQLLPDRSQTIIASNDSPDVPFHYSVNPYRGCEHGCVYCYAHPTHEQLGMSAGLDFESKILVKYDAARLLRRELNRPGWQGETIALSGVTDCYQPCERETADHTQRAGSDARGTADDDDRVQECPAAARPGSVGRNGETTTGASGDEHHVT